MLDENMGKSNLNDTANKGEDQGYNSPYFDEEGRWVHGMFGKVPGSEEHKNPALHRVVPTKFDYEALRPYFGYRPTEVVRETIRQTTQLATSIIRFPMRRHFKSRFQMLRKKRLNEVVATDTYFSKVRSLEGYHCAQVYFGCTSKTIDVFGMKSKSEFPDTYKDFLRERGIPHTLRRDNAKEEDSSAIKEINRDLIVCDQFTEPHHPQQNPAERNGVQFLKAQAQILMDRTNSPPNTWFLCQKYIADVYNVSAHPTNDWKIPNQLSGGETVDVSHLLQFKWFEPVLYLDPREKFSKSKEKPGYFVGFAENVGDVLTFKVLTEDKRIVLSRSVVRC